MKVRATKLGYYGRQRRRPGDEFEVDESKLSKRWMEPVDGSKAPEKPEPVKPKPAARPKDVI